MLSLLLVIFVFSTSSHQLTPFFMVAACAGLVIVRRCRLRGLPVLFAVIFTAWLSFAAVPYWSGHRSELFGGLGNLGANLSTSVSGRLAGSTPLHTLVLYSRTAFAGAVVVLAVAGLARRWRLGFDDRVALVLMCVSFAGFGLQSYGGEIALRVYLFALPGAALLVAYLFFPGLGGPRRTRRLPVPGRGAWRLLGAARDRRAWLVVPLAAVCSVAAVLLFFVARYGNEAFERTPAGELTAMNYLYAHDSTGIRVLWTSELPAVDDTPQMPWQYRDLARTDYIAELAPTSPTQVAGLAADLRAMGPGSYLITTTTQETYLAQAANYPASWGRQFRAAMASYPGIRIAFSDRDAVVYTYRWPAGTRHQPLPPVTGSPGPPDRLDTDRAGRSRPPAAGPGRAGVQPHLAAGFPVADPVPRAGATSAARLLRFRRHHPIRGPVMTAANQGKINGNSAGQGRRGAARPGTRQMSRRAPAPALPVDRDVAALIVKVGNYPLHHGGVDAIRSLGRLGVPVYAVSEDRWTPAALSRYCRGHYVWPAEERADPERMVERLQEAGREIPGRRCSSRPTKRRPS